MDILKASYISNLAAPNDIDPIRVVDNYTVGDVLKWGSDNQFPNQLAELYRKSNVHRSVLKDKISYYVGKEYVSEDYQDVIDKVNNDNEGLKSLSNKLTKDFQLTGNMFVMVVTDVKRSFVHYYHIDSTTARLDKNKENILISSNWKLYFRKDDKYVQTLPLWPNFEQDGQLLKSVVHMKDYEPEFKNYGVPDYIAGREEMTIDYKTSKYNLSKIVNFFGGNKIVFFPAKSDPEAKAFIDNLKTNHIGEGQNGKTMYQPYQAGTNINNAVDKVQVVDVGGDDRGGWMEISNKAKSDIIMAHSWYRALMSTGDNTGFDTDRVYQEYQAALVQIVNYQDMLIELFENVYKTILGIEIDLTIINKPPIDMEIKADDLLLLWELRRNKGMEFNPDDVNQQITVGEWRSKISKT
jgi:predicted transcriptional regulator with HTH domain